MFGKLNPLPVDEFLEIYYKTGIDVDGRLKGMKGYFPSFEEACSKFVQYAQELPDFDKLGKEDQVSLLKGISTNEKSQAHIQRQTHVNKNIKSKHFSGFLFDNPVTYLLLRYFHLILGSKASFWLLSDFPSIDVENGLYTNQNYVTLNREEISYFFSEIYATKLFSIVGRLQRLNLTPDEVNVMRAFVIFNPGEK